MPRRLSKTQNGIVQTDYDPLVQILSGIRQTDRKVIEIKKMLKIIVATGLHQQPHGHLTFYWRLKEHVKFAEMIGSRKLHGDLAKNVKRFSSEIS